MASRLKAPALARVSHRGHGHPRTHDERGSRGGGARARGVDVRRHDGERVELRVAYTRGSATRSRADSVVWLGLRPEFQRTYHIDQATDVVRRRHLSDRVSQLSFSATGPVLAPLFDGSQTLLGVTAVGTTFARSLIP